MKLNDTIMGVAVEQIAGMEFKKTALKMIVIHIGSLNIRVQKGKSLEERN